jgi:ribosomal-protein-alanine N-acetyltransferase
VSVTVLTTERLVLREPVATDAEAILVFRGDPEVQRYNAEPLRDLAETVQFIELLQAETAANLRRHWAITLDGAVVGLIGLHTWEQDHRRAELGYDMAREYWGRGLATEAGRAVIQFGFTTMALHRIEAGTIADNVRSVRLLERLGFQREGTLRERSLEQDGTFHDSAVFGLLHTDA